MIGLMGAEDQEQPRLYSKEVRAPVDIVAVEHLVVHADCERWGRWNRAGRPVGGSCASIEGEYMSSLDGTGDGGRQTRAAVVSLPPDPLLARIEVIVVSMMQHSVTEQQGETLREFYCKRWALKTICWAHALRYEGFSRWMFLCRQSVLNALGACADEPPDPV